MQLHLKTHGKQEKPSSWSMTVLKKWFNRNNNLFDLSVDDRDNCTEIADDDEDQERGYCMLRRSNSETLRAQYIDAKDIRICVGTWNVGGKVPHDDLNIEEWLDTNEPADMYVLGFQEIVPLNAGNIFGVEDSSPVSTWENIIRQTLNKVQTKKPTFKSYSDPPSPSRFEPSDVALAITEGLLLHEIDGESHKEGIHLSKEFQNECDDFSRISTENTLSVRGLDRCRAFTLIDNEMIPETPIPKQKKLSRTFSSSEKIGLAWPEQPRELLAKCASDNLNSFRLKSFKTCSPLKSASVVQKDSLCSGLVQEFDPHAVLCRKKMSSFVKIINKQMVGIFISIWVRGSLRKHIQNLKVSTVGIGAMGYIGNKLKHELKIGGTFDGWKEGKINFPPTYKYEYDSSKYIKEDSKSGRRTPAWCDRILRFGKGMKLLSYKRCELKLSDHRPVTATFLVEVEVFSHKKLQKALTLTDAEVDEGKIVDAIDIALNMGRLMV